MLSAPEVDDLLVWLAPQARVMARAWSARVPVEEGVLFGFALEGAWRAVHRFDGRTAGLWGYACLAMQRAIVDGAREETGARRTGARRARVADLIPVGLGPELDAAAGPAPVDVSAADRLADVWPDVARALPGDLLAVLEGVFLVDGSPALTGARLGMSVQRVTRARDCALVAAAAAVA